MGKTAWFITHDSYIDRRIFFFVDSMRRRGYSVKLFPANFFDTLVVQDYAYVQRPWRRKLVREYSVDRTSLPLIVQSKIKISKKICDMQDSMIYYDRKNDSIIKGYKDADMLTVRKIENAIIQSKLEGNGEYENSEVKLSYKINEDFDHCFYAQVKGDFHLYEYNLNREILSELVPIKRELKGAFSAENRKFEDFISVIYDYTDIICRVQEEFEYEKPDVVYVADLPTLPIGIILKRLSGCKLVMDCHEWWYKQTILWEGSNQKKINLVDKYEKELYPQCDVCITVGKHLANRMKTHINCNFATIYSCMSELFMQNIKIDKMFLREKYNLPKDAKILIFQGGMSTHRNLDNLARMTKFFDDDVFLLLLTTGTYQEEFKKVLEQEGKPDRVVWGGWIEQAHLLEYTKNADLGIIPYVAVNDYAECFVPNKLMEYYSVQLPIVFDPSIKELAMVIGDNKLGFGADLTKPREAGIFINNLLHDEEKLKICKEAYLKCDGCFSSKYQEMIYGELMDDFVI